MERRISVADVDRWVASGIITAEQRQQMLLDLETRSPASAGVTLTSVLYYGGGLLVLLAYSFFMSLQWEDMEEGGRLVIAGFSLIFFWGISITLLRTERFKLPGELLQVVAVATVPLTMFALLDSAGIWPQDPGFRASNGARMDYQQELALARMAVVAPMVLAAGAALWWSRSPYVLVALLVGVTSFAIDVTTLVRGPDASHYTWTTSEQAVVTVLGALYIVTGVFARRYEERDYSFWFYVTGIATLATGLGGLAFPYDAAMGWGALWVVASLALIGIAVPLQERLLAAAGIAGVIAYSAVLVFDVFESANAALALVVLGLIVLGLGMLYQRYSDRVFQPGPN